MAGIDRIKESILSEANAKVESILEEAKTAAKQVTDTAASDAQKIRTEAADKAERSSKDYAGRIQSQIAMQQKQTILAAKQDLITDVIKAAREKLLSLPDAEYFQVILRLLDQNIQKGKGEILFNAKDLSRLPADFKDQLDEAAKKKGADLRLSDEAAGIDSGFILRYRDGSEDANSSSNYGSVELNCSFESLIAEKKDQLSDLITQKLF